MKPLHELDGPGHMLCVGTVRTGKTHLLMQLQLAALQTPPAMPVTAWRIPVTEQQAQALLGAPGKEAR
jgi:hypothetical protein